MLQDEQQACADCLSAARAGDSEAVQKLCLAFEEFARSSAKRQMGARAKRFIEPVAVAQDVLFEVLAKPAKLPSNADAKMIRQRLSRAVRSRILQELRRNQRHVGESVLQRSPAHPLPLASGSTTRADTRRWLLALIEELPPKYAEIVRLCALEDFTFVQAGKALGLEADAVRKRYTRARERLQRAIDRRQS